MVADALLVVADTLGVEECHRKPQEFCEIVAEYAHTDMGAHVKSDPTAYKAHRERPDEERHLRQHDVDDQSHVAHADSLVHHLLCQERSDERKQQA